MYRGSSISGEGLKDTMGSRLKNRKKQVKHKKSGYVGFHTRDPRPSGHDDYMNYTFPGFIAFFDPTVTLVSFTKKMCDFH